MYKVDMEDAGLFVRMSSKLGFVDRAMNEIEAFVEGQEGRIPSEEMNLAVRELLLNAIEHGNGGDESKVVELEMANVAPSRYRLDVKDEGPGLPAGALPPRRELAATQERSRGLLLVNSCSDLFESAGPGMVRAWFTIAKETRFETVVEAAEAAIRPTGSITAAVAEKFRQALLAWYSSDVPSARLDCSRVDNIDSICLSVLVALANMEGVRSGARAFRLTNLSPGLDRLFRLTRLHTTFKI